MEFIEKLYSNELFAPILFTIVGILAVLFVVVLILALRDAKKSKKDVVEVANNVDEFNKMSEEVVETPIATNELEEKEEVKEEVINNVIPVSDSFEEVTIEAPETELEEDNKIKIENEEVASIELERAENDLDEIAATLLKEYQKEKEDDEEVVEKPQVAEQQISPVFVTPDTIPVKEEEKESIEMPILNDIPVPQPVRVVQSSQIIDSSKKENVSINDIETEEYNIKR